jgi:hypothetical protein
MKRTGRILLTLSLVLASAAILSTLAMGPSATAAWSARLTASGSVSAGSVGIAFAGGLPAIGFTNSSLSSTAPIGVSNTTVTETAPAAELQLSLSGPAESGLAVVTSLTVWSVPAPSECDGGSAPGADAVTGTWANGVTLNGGPLSPGETKAYCIRSSVGSRQAVAAITGAQSFEAHVAAHLVLHSFSSSASSLSEMASAHMFPFASLTDAWYNFMPSGQDACLDVSDGLSAGPGSGLGTYPCWGSYSADQWFASVPFSDHLVGIRAGVADLRAEAQADGAVLLQADDPSNPSQWWEPQLVSPGVVQFVSDLTGMCLTVPPSFGPASMSVCDGSPGQSFVAVEL